MDKYVDYAKGKDLKGEMPLYLQPARPVALQDVMNAMRDHYEDTPFDIRGEIGAGPYNMPYRPTPLEFEVDGKKYFNERPVSTQQTSFCFVGQMRSSLPDAVGGIAWVTNDDPNMAPFVPLYCSLGSMPRCFQRVNGEQDDLTFSWESAFWLQNSVSNMVYPYYEKMFPDVLQSRNAVEGDAQSAIAAFEATPQAQIADYRQQLCDSRAKTMMLSWHTLFGQLMVKHLDMAEKKQAPDGTFLKTEHGLSQPPQRPGYPEAFRRRIVQEDGAAYSMP